jgi:hypothetical protein
MRFYSRWTVLKVISNKMVKYRKVCSDNQHIFISFVFDIFGFLISKIVNYLKKVQKVMYNNNMSLRSMNVVFQRLNFIIQKY